MIMLLVSMILDDLVYWLIQVTTEPLEDSALPKKIMHFVVVYNHSVAIAEDKELYVGKELKWSTWL